MFSEKGKFFEYINFLNQFISRLFQELFDFKNYSLRFLLMVQNMVKKVVGLTGSIASGKKLVKEALMRKYTAYYSSLSALIMEEAIKKRGLPVNKETKGAFATEMRERYGGEVLARVAWNFLNKDKELIIIDDIKNPSEIEFLKRASGGNFVLIGVDAPVEKRWKHVEEAHAHGAASLKDPKTMEDFLKLDAAELMSGGPHGLHVNQCIAMADHVIVNDGSVEDFKKKIAEVVDKI